MNAFVAGATGPIGTHFVPMTEIRGTSNAKARSVLGWQPPWPT